MSWVRNLRRGVRVNFMKAVPEGLGRFYKSAVLWSVFITGLLTIVASGPAQALASDPDLGKKVKMELSTLKLDAHEIDIETKGGLVTLSGWVASEYDRALVEVTIREMERVVAVKNELRVNDSVRRNVPAQQIAPVAPPQPQSDAEIERNLLLSLQSEPDIDLSGITLQVRNRVAFFSGRVGQHRQIDRILSHTLMVEGIENVQSNVVIGSH